MNTIQRKFFQPIQVIRLVLRGISCYDLVGGENVFVGVEGNVVGDDEQRALGQFEFGRKGCADDVDEGRDGGQRDKA